MMQIVKEYVRFLAEVIIIQIQFFQKFVVDEHILEHDFPLGLIQVLFFITIHIYLFVEEAFTEQDFLGVREVQIFDGFVVEEACHAQSRQDLQIVLFFGIFC